MRAVPKLTVVWIVGASSVAFALPRATRTDRRGAQSAAPVADSAHPYRVAAPRAEIEMRAPTAAATMAAPVPVVRQGGAGAPAHHVVVSDRPPRVTPVAPPSVRVEVTLDGIVGSVSRPMIERVVRAREITMATCYSNALRTNPSLQGLIIVRFEIAPNGASDEPHVAASYVQDPQVALCVASAFRAIRVQATHATSTALVTYRVRLQRGPTTPPA